ncbi:MAG: ArsR family transcriptional regulator [Phycisphaerales bacterium]|nr:ArsR family transcriptional regulator [Phycisphaerales bacterium]
MSYDTLIANAGRLRILTALAVENRQEFVNLRKMTCLTDGNLSAHARRLQGGGLIDIEKSFREGKPVTTFHLNETGRRRLTEHAQALLAAVSGVALREPVPVDASADDEWVD